MDPIDKATAKHAAACLDALPLGLLQCRSAMAMSASALRQVEQPSRKRPVACPENCKFCGRFIDRQKAAASVGRKGRRKKSQIVFVVRCDFCGRECFNRNLPRLPPLANRSSVTGGKADSSFDVAIQKDNVGQTGSAEVEKKKKKQRKKKDPAAGLKLVLGAKPVVAPGGQAKEKTVNISKEKLKRFLDLGLPSKQGGIRDLLKK